MAITKGNAIVWAFEETGTSTSASITGFTGAIADGYTFTGLDNSLQYDKEELRDGNGAVQTVYLSNARRELSLKCYPSGSNADATSAPLVGEEVFVSLGDAHDSGTWLCESVSKTRKQDGIVEFDIKLNKYFTGTGGGQHIPTFVP